LGLKIKNPNSSPGKIGRRRRFGTGDDLGCNTVYLYKPVVTPGIAENS
jgi:hypothetical protein